MPHISSRKLDQVLLDKLLKKLVLIIGKAQDKNSLSPVLKELLTRTEKIMLAKRLAIVFLLSKKIPQDKISDLLKVSPTTVAKISLKMEMGKYNNILKVSAKEKFDLEELIMGILTLGGLMPPKVGKRYWVKKNKR